MHSGVFINLQDFIYDLNRKTGIGLVKVKARKKKSRWGRGEGKDFYIGSGR